MPLSCLLAHGLVARGPAGAGLPRLSPAARPLTGTQLGRGVPPALLIQLVLKYPPRHAATAGTRIHAGCGIFVPKDTVS